MTGRAGIAALLPLVVLLLVVAAGATTVGLGTELLIVALLLSASTAAALARRAGASWSAVQQAAGRRLADALPALLILLAIGMLIGSWMLSGTIPMLVALGIRLIDPQHLVVTSFVVTAIMSLATGTSWGAAGTLGVALMGTAAAVDAPLAATAGAVVSGAYLGDKVSPLSDSTNICALGAGADLYKHIRHLLWTAVPSAALALAVYALAGTSPAPTSSPAEATRLLGELEGLFHLSPLCLVPAAVALLGIALRQPAAPTLALSSLVALILATTLQGFGLRAAVQAAISGFDRAALTATGHDPGALSAAAARILERGGLLSMAPTLVLVMVAFLLTGAVEASGGLAALLARLTRAVRGVRGLITATMAAGAGMIALTSHGGVTALVVGDLFRDLYRRHGLAPENLSRSLEDAVTLTEPLMPWTVSALFMATTLGVPTLEYAPWAVFCYGGPVLSLLIAHLGALTARALAPREDTPSDPA